MTTSVFRKAAKMLRIAGHPLYRAAIRQGVAAAVEHECLLRHLEYETLVDIGANRGQFALVSRRCRPKARLYSFEPLPRPAEIFGKLFETDPLTTLFQTAIGPENASLSMHVAQRDDSSSLLDITEQQARIFPGTAESHTAEVNVARLADFLTANDIGSPAVLKIDVQGFELEVLKGCEDLLSHFGYAYIECSFVELYKDQALADEVISWTHARGLALGGVYNVYYDSNGKTVQADLLFTREDAPAA